MPQSSFYHQGNESEASVETQNIKGPRCLVYKGTMLAVALGAQSHS